jgi:cytochrome c oxidase cbb3-type subunit 3
MRHGRPSSIGIALLPAAFALGACDVGDLRGTTSAASPLPVSAQPPRVPGSALIPGGAAREVTLHNPYWRDPDAIRDGERLYGWYNCSGCHAGGGGGMGPPLMDDQWIYGNRPANLYDVIVEGRPAGMPAFGGKIPDDQIWKIIAFIESMGGMQYQDEVVAAGDAFEQNQTQSQD